MLEVGANCVNLIDQIFSGVDAGLAEGLLDDGVAGEGNSLPGNLAVSSLVDELLDGLTSGVAESDVRLNFSQQNA